MECSYEKIEQEVNLIRNELAELLIQTSECVMRAQMLLNGLSERVVWQAYFADYAQKTLTDDLRPED